MATRQQSAGSYRERQTVPSSSTRLPSPHEARTSTGEITHRVRRLLPATSFPRTPFPEVDVPHRPHRNQTWSRFSSEQRGTDRISPSVRHERLPLTEKCEPRKVVCRSSLPDPSAVQAALECALQAAEQQRDRRVHDRMALHGLHQAFSKRVTTSSLLNPFDSAKQYALSALVRDHGYSLPQLVELVRGQTPEDGRPNKALCPIRYSRLLKGYRHLQLLCSVASEGIDPEWCADPPLSKTSPANHQSANRHLAAVIASIRSGQDAGQYLVLDTHIGDSWSTVQVSPFGAIPKKDADPSKEVRLIHDLSYPRGLSTNDACDNRSFFTATYRSVAAIAKRIDQCASCHPGVQVFVLKGDVKGAFRHLMLASRSVRWMGGYLPQCGALILDMSAPFGWAGSPPFYAGSGGAISWLVGRESPHTLSGGALNDDEPFFPYEWVGDHVMVEAATPGRLHAAETALRLAMLAVLGPRSINEKKFSKWSTRLEVLGLAFDTVLRTVSMPVPKIKKALERVRCAAASSSLCRHDLESLLGSLRHVCTCLRAARPFFQRVQAACKRSPRRGRVRVDPALLMGFEWLQVILTSGD